MPTYDGPVTILDSGHSSGIIEKIASDERLEIDVERIDVKQLRKNTCYVAKSRLWRWTPYQTTILLDADTIVEKDPAKLFDLAESRGSGGVVVTHFSNWETTGDIIRGRIERWRDIHVKSNDREFQRSISGLELVDASLSFPHAAINTGVMAWLAEAGAFLRDWERLTEAGAELPFTDELSAQLLIRRHNHTLVGDRFNCSPIYGHERRNVTIWHAHGSKHLRRADGRGGEGHAIWWPWVVDAWRENAGRIREWAPAGDDAFAFNLEAVRKEA